MKKPHKFYCYTAISFLSAALLTACVVFSNPEGPECVDDIAIASHVKSSILNDPYLHNYEVYIKAFQKEVYLTGFVRSKQQSERVEYLSKRIKGVRAVKNNLFIFPPLVQKQIS